MAVVFLDRFSLGWAGDSVPGQRGSRRVWVERLEQGREQVAQDAALAEDDVGPGRHPRKDDFPGQRAIGGASFNGDAVIAAAFFVRERVGADFGQASVERAIDGIVVCPDHHARRQAGAERGPVVRADARLDGERAVAGGDFENRLAGFDDAPEGVEVQAVDEAADRRADLGSPRRSLSPLTAWPRRSSSPPTWLQFEAGIGAKAGVGFGQARFHFADRGREAGDRGHRLALRAEHALRPALGLDQFQLRRRAAAACKPSSNWLCWRARSISVA